MCFASFRVSTSSAGLPGSLTYGTHWHRGLKNNQTLQGEGGNGPDHSVLPTTGAGAGLWVDVSDKCRNPTLSSGLWHSFTPGPGLGRQVGSFRELLILASGSVPLGSWLLPVTKFCWLLRWLVSGPCHQANPYNSLHPATVSTLKMSIGPQGGQRWPVTSPLSSSQATLPMV